MSLSTHAYDIGTRSTLELHITGPLWGNPPVMRLSETRTTEALKGHRVVWKIEICYLMRMT